MNDPYLQTKSGGKKNRVHRVIMERQIGRPLLRSEIVHHKNGDKLDNRIENLEIVSHKAHSVHHQQKHPITKICVICGAEFTPHPTKRARKQTCGNECRYKLIAQRLRSKRGKRS